MGAAGLYKWPQGPSPLIAQAWNQDGLSFLSISDLSLSLVFFPGPLLLLPTLILLSFSSSSLRQGWMGGGRAQPGTH